MHACPWSMDLGWTWTEGSARGTIYSYETVVHSIQPGFKDATQYTAVLLELAEQRGQPAPDETVRSIGVLVKPDCDPVSDVKEAREVAIVRRVRVVLRDRGG